MSDDEPKPSNTEAVGALSRISDGTVRSALGLAKTGRIYDLGLELNSGIPHNPEFVRFAMSFTHTPEGTGARSPFQYSVESVFGALHIGTHIDSFIHIQKDGRIYGGHLASEARDDRAGSGTASRRCPRSSAARSVSIFPDLRDSGGYRIDMRSQWTI
jgi:hypothetical protein